MSFTPTTAIPSLWGWTDFTAALPSFYWDVESAEQRIKKICCELHKLCEYANMLGQNINIDHDLINELQNAFEKFMEHGFDDYYKEQVYNWISDNLNGILAGVVGHVYFGLTKDGHFCAYIPEGWNDITFDIGSVYGRSDYGRIILRMNVDDENSIDNTYSYSLAQPTTVEQLIADLEITTKRGDASYDALFTNMNEVISNGNF